MTAVRKTLGELAALCGGELRRADGATAIRGVASLADALGEDLAFYTNPAYRQDLGSSRAAVILVGPKDAGLPELNARPILVAALPYAAFARISAAFHPPHSVVAGVDPAARIEPGATIDPSARVEAFAWVGPGASVGPRASIQAGACVGARATIGADSVIASRAVVRDRCVIGDRCVIHSGAVIGADGFGFAFDPEGDGDGPMHRKVPQVGIVRIEDDVEIGANSCVDRATLGETVIGRGTKIDNLVQIAHNVQIGPMCVIAAQTGIAGSTTVGAGVAMGGQTGIVGHVHIGDMARIGAQSGVHKSMEAGEAVVGYPALEQKTWLRVSGALTHLPDLLREVRRLAKRLTALEAKKD